MTQQEARYERNPDFIFRKIVDEMVLVPIHQDVADMDCIYTLNSVGASIWEQARPAGDAGRAPVRPAGGVRRGPGGRSLPTWTAFWSR